MRLLTPARAAMRSTRPPPKPWVANSVVAAARMASAVAVLLRACRRRLPIADRAAAFGALISRTPCWPGLGGPWPMPAIHVQRSALRQRTPCAPAKGQAIVRAAFAGCSWHASRRHLRQAADAADGAGGIRRTLGLVDERLDRSRLANARPKPALARAKPSIAEQRTQRRHH